MKSQPQFKIGDYVTGKPGNQFEHVAGEIISIVKCDSFREADCEGCPGQMVVGTGNPGCYRTPIKWLIRKSNPVTSSLLKSIKDKLRRTD